MSNFSEGEVTRIHIIQQMNKLVNEKEMILTWDDMAAELNLSRSKITNYFPKKELLILAIFFDFEEKLKIQIESLKAGNRQVILSSRAYESKASCMNGVESVRKNSQEDARYERKTAKNGSPYFNLKSTNSQVIGNSEMYSLATAMENGIASIKKNAPVAKVEDHS